MTLGMVTDAFLDTIPKTSSMKEINDKLKLHFVKIKAFCSIKDSIKRNEKTSQRLTENIFNRLML